MKELPSLYQAQRELQKAIEKMPADSGMASISNALLAIVVALEKIKIDQELAANRMAVILKSVDEIDHYNPQP